MALPVLTKTWQFSVNNTTGAFVTLIDANRTWVRSVKDALLAFASSAWAMRYSCDSVTAGSAGDGVDRIMTNAGLVWATAGSAHSWMVLRQTGIATNYELLFSCEPASSAGNTTGNSLTLVVSPSAGFTGGTTTARPTATDEIVLFSAVSWGIGVGTTPIRWHAMQSSDGQCTRIISYVGGTLQNVILLDKPTNSASGWTNPSMSYAALTTALTPATLGATTGSFRCRIGGTLALLSLSAEGLIGGIVNTTFPTNTGWGNIANEVSGEWPMLPLGAVSVTAPVRGRMGQFQDMWTGSAGANTGDTYPSGASNQFAQFGALILPWNGSAVQLS